MDDLTATATWHRPMIHEFDILISPLPGQLRLSTRHPKKAHTDKERDALMNKESQDRWRGRQYDRVDLTKENKRICCTVDYDADVLNMLVAADELQDHETGDPKLVGEAISVMLADMAKAGKAKW